MSIPVLGLILQVFFMLSISVFNFIRIFVMEQFNVYPVAFFELFLGLASFVSGIYGILKRINPLISIFVSLFGVLICVFFVFVYLVPEAGIPPVIPWLYSE
ncbi:MULTISPECIES: hypothetical protein [Sporosarcina]|uniref:hypothetical protein n=1 Tax=Sporosarcina TaxID=1569 RepID=UPI00078B7EAD|nr:hypothetical protein [Sporosarcina psychrophila]AMQ05418.1 hypothetical protein AZE41_05535 [Sporosarcina psychrophila]